MRHAIEHDNGQLFIVVLRFCMEGIDWDLLRTFAAVARHSSLTAAAEALAVSQSTVSRQLNRLEQQVGGQLLVRGSPVTLTDQGLVLERAVGPMVEAALSVEAALADQPTVCGTVTVTTVGEVLRWALVDHLPEFCASYPELRLEFLAGNRVDSLAAGDADIALRFFKPQRGDLVARKLTTERYGFFVAQSLERAPGEPWPWLGLTGSLAGIAKQRHAELAFADRPARLRVEDFEALGMLVQRGLGIALLPSQFASRLEGVRELTPCEAGAEAAGPISGQELWLVVHRSKRAVPKIRAVLDWLTTVLAGERVPEG